jgi:hypothetical protein
MLTIRSLRRLSCALILTTAFAFSVSALSPVAFGCNGTGTAGGCLKAAPPRPTLDPWFTILIVIESFL